MKINIWTGKNRFYFSAAHFTECAWYVVGLYTPLAFKSKIYMCPQMISQQFHSHLSCLTGVSTLQSFKLCFVLNENKRVQFFFQLSWCLKRTHWMRDLKRWAKIRDLLGDQKNLWVAVKSLCKKKKKKLVKVMQFVAPLLFSGVLTVPITRILSSSK